MNTSQAGPAQANEDIVKFAYCMAIGEQRYLELFSSLRSRLEELLKQDENAAHDAQSRAEITAELEALEVHFSNALSLLDLSGRQKDSVLFSQKLMDASDAPAALVDRQGRVVLANSAARDVLGFEVGAYAPSERFERGQHKNFLGNLAKIEEFPENKVISLFGLYAQGADDPFHFAMMRVDRLEGDTLAYLEVAKINWLPEKAAHFQSLFGLTPSEMDITKGLVNGVSLNAIAQRRGTSVGTVRQQVKQLLAKLELRSQSELICLYSGVVKYDGYVTKTEPSSGHFDTGEPGQFGRLFTFECDDGRQLEYEIVGARDDHPVLFLPALLGGSAVTREMTAAIAQSGIKLIIPWRPCMGNTDPCGPPTLARFADYAADIDALLGSLEIEKIAVLGHITSAMFAYALAHYLPKRISHVANVNGIIPVNSGQHVKLLNPAERLRFHVHRHLPKIASMVMHSMLRVVDSGQDLEFLSVFLERNPEDLAIIQRDDIKASFRATHNHITANGFTGFSHELTLASLDWQYLLSGLSCPLLNLVGAKNLSFTPELLRTFEVEKSLDLKLEVVEQAGHLALYQKSDLIFARVAQLVRS